MYHIDSTSVICLLIHIIDREGSGEERERRGANKEKRRRRRRGEKKEEGREEGEAKKNGLGFWVWAGKGE